MNWDVFMKAVVMSLVFSLLGMGVFVAGYFVLKMVLPFDVAKELEHDHNTSVGIVVGSFILGLAFIVGMAIHG